MSASGVVHLITAPGSLGMVFLLCDLVDQRLWHPVVCHWPDRALLWVLHPQSPPFGLTGCPCSCVEANQLWQEKEEENACNRN